MLIDRTDNFSDGSIEVFQHRVADGERIFRVTLVARRRIEWSVDGVEWHIQEKGLIILFLSAGSDVALGLGSEKVGRITFLLQGLLIAMPVVNGKARRGIMHNRLGVVIDSPSVMTILVIEALPHRKVLGKPLAEMPLADQSGAVAGFLKRFSNGSLIGIEGVNAPRRLPAVIVSQRQTERLEVARFSEILAAPVGPSTERVAASKESGTGRGTYRVRVILCEAEALGGKLVNVWAKRLLTAVEPGLVPAHVISHHEDNVRPASGMILSLQESGKHSSHG